MSNPEESELLQRLAAEDAQAFDDLVGLYQDKVVNTCYRFVHNLQDAEDVAQDVFIEIYQSLDSFRGQSALSTWIYRIAVTRSLDFIRRKTRKKRTGRFKRLLGYDTEEGRQEIEIPDPGTDPLDDLEREERFFLLHRALGSLPENQRTAVILNKFEGLSQAEVADVMGNTVSAVESLLHRAKQNLHKKLYHYFEKNPMDTAGTRLK